MREELDVALSEARAPLGETVVAPRHCYAGTLVQLATLEQRGAVKVRLVDIEKHRVESYSMLREQLGSLMEVQRTANQQTGALVTALLAIAIVSSLMFSSGSGGSESSASARQETGPPAAQPVPPVEKPVPPVQEPVSPVVNPVTPVE